MSTKTLNAYDAIELLDGERVLDNLPRVDTFDVSEDGKCASVRLTDGTNMEYMKGVGWTTV